MARTAAKRDPGDLEHREQMLTSIKKQAELGERLTALDGRADPRIATALHALPFLEATPSLQRLSLPTDDLAAWTPWLVERGYELT